MDFRFNPAEEAFRREVQEFIETECPADLRQGEVVSSEQLDLLFEWRKKVAAKGWLAPAWPREYGGAELSVMEQFIYNLETARMGAPASIFVGGMGVNIVGPTIIIYGNDEQKKKYITGILSGEDIWCQGFSEPGAGSDLAGLSTRAVRDGDEYVINGQKIWTSLAHKADYMLTLARTDPDAPKHKGISYLVVPVNSEGITIRPLPNMAGSHEFNEVFLEDVRVPVSNLLGEENRGWYQAVTTLDIERSGIGHVVGLQRTVKDLVEFVKHNHGNGVVQTGTNPSLRAELAERYIETEVAAALSFRLVTLQARGVQGNHEASASKLYYSEVSQRIASTGVRLLGLYGQLNRNAKWAPLSGRLQYRYLRAVSDTIAGGTSEIQKGIIATRGLGLPRE
jgi:alkylation response protein AidB-like acyl-CoA dehydrogenase